MKINEKLIGGFYCFVLTSILYMSFKDICKGEEGVGFYSRKGGSSLPLLAGVSDIIGVGRVTSSVSLAVMPSMYMGAPASKI